MQEELTGKIFLKDKFKIKKYKRIDFSNNVI